MTEITDAPLNPARLALDGAGRAYGSVLALAPVTLRLAPGSVCVVTGENGSGKTTLLRVAAGLAAPTWGTRAAASPALYLGPGDGARSSQTARQAVAFAAALRGGEDYAAVLDQVGLGQLAERRVRTLSAGQRARLTLGVALACRPALACLDEPTAHLDAAGVELAAATVRRLAETGTAVLVATHDREFLAAEADGRVHLEQGMLAFRGAV